MFWAAVEGFSSHRAPRFAKTINEVLQHIATSGFRSPRVEEGGPDGICLNYPRPLHGSLKLKISKGQIRQALQPSPAVTCWFGRTLDSVSLTPRAYQLMRLSYDVKLPDQSRTVSPSYTSSPPRGCKL